MYNRFSQPFKTLFQPFSKLFSVHIDSCDQIKPITLPMILEKYMKNIPLTMLTAHDYSSSQSCDKAQIDMILVGDSLAMTALGHPNTLSVTMDQMIHHAKAVKRGSKYCFLIGDMPFGSYLTDDDAIRNAARFIQEAEMNSVKLEGGIQVASKVKAFVKAGMVVIGHIGLTPQHTNHFGGFKVFGARETEEAIKLWEDAKALRDAGASSIVLECVPDKLASLITQNLGIPTIGIGSGNGCSGQVLVFNDLVGIYDRMSLKFCKKYLDLNPMIINACKNYKQEVEAKLFPVKSINTFIIKEEVLKNVSKFVLSDAEAIVFPKEENKEKHIIPSTVLPIKNIVILGTGALGSLIASKMNNLNEKNIRILPGKLGEHPDYINIGVSVNTDKEEHKLKVLDLNEFKNSWESCIDLLVVCSKNYATKESINNLISLTNKNIKINNIVTLQNGFGNVEEIHNLMNTLQIKTNVFPISIYSGVKINMKMRENIDITQSNSNKIQISLPKILAQTEIENIFKQSKDFEIVNYIKSTIIAEEITMDWEKLLINSVINPITAIFNVKNQQVFNDVHLQNLSKMIIKECLNIYRLIPGAIASFSKEGHLNIEDILFQKVMNVAKLTGTNTSSMLIDVLSDEGLTEIDSLNGAFVKLGTLLKIPENNFAINKMLCEMVKSKCNAKKLDKIIK